MIPFGRLDVVNQQARQSTFSQNQMKTFIAQRALAASPLIIGGDLLTMDDFSYTLLTNPEMLACNQNGVMGVDVYRAGNIDVWLTPHTIDPGAGWIGIFNRSKSDRKVTLTRQDLGFVAFEASYNLTAARQVVFNDLDWVPANHWQAEDRAYRIGQTQTVNVHYLVGVGTVEEFVQAVLERKAALVEAVVEGRAAKFGGGVLEELERLIALMSPRLASVRDADLSAEDAEQVLTEARALLRAERTEPEGAGGPKGDPVLMERALSMLKDVLAGPRSQRFRVTSNSRPGAFYDLEVIGGDVLCSCPGFEYRGACSHARKLKAALAGGSRLPAGYTAVGAAS